MRTQGPALRAAAFATALLSCLPVSALHFYADPPFLHVQGRVDSADWRVWREAIEIYEGKLTTVVFHRSPGGHSGTGRLIGTSIRKLGLRTVVAGRCISACANMFLGGKQRMFSSRMHEQPTVLGYHGSYSRTTGDVNRNASGDYFREMSDGKMNDALIERFIGIERRTGALYFIHIDQRTDASQPAAYFCEGEENSSRRDEECARVNLDALEAGIVTTWDVVVTPPSPRQKPGVVTSKNW